MVLNTLTVGAAVTPSVIETAISHYIKRGPLRGKPTAHISYDEGLHLVRQFLDYASNHTVDEVQSFTAQWVPCPRWVKASDFDIPDSHLSHAASLLETQLGPYGISAVGGTQWWQWRPANTPLKAEWIEMRADYNARKAASQPAQRIILYIHGGAYYFGSVDEHRYQLQRHARKLKARLLAPRYRLAPQFPFPCGLHDALASYLYLLTEFDPSSILLMGDSAGGGMVLSLLVILRDQGVPLPAGAILISPWVDLTHSFPSVSGEGKLDYIPPYGFHHRPSLAWPPPNEDELRDLHKQVDAHKTKEEAKAKEKEAVSGLKVKDSPHNSEPEHREPAPNPPPLSINLDGKHLTLIDQIQLYATNTLLSHPLVSPALEPSLGGLPPLLIQTGGGELLRDEQVYLAHKAANPTEYLSSDIILDLHDPKREMASKYPPTKVQLQVWEDLCHVPHTLSFTRPAKHMYRAVAQFGNWVFSQSSRSQYATGTATKAQKDDDALSIISTSTSSGSSDEETLQSKPRSRTNSKSSHQQPRSLSEGAVPPPSDRATPSTTSWANITHLTPTGTEPQVSATDPLPAFENSMIRQLISRHGTIFPLAPASAIPALSVPRPSIGAIKEGPVRKWLSKKSEWDRKFASQKRKVQGKRLEEMRKGYATFTTKDANGVPKVERPPPTALAGRQFVLDVKGAKGKMGMGKIGEGLQNLDPRGQGKKKSWGLMMWSGWGSKHDEATIESSGAAAAIVAGATAGGVAGNAGAGRTGAEEERGRKGKGQGEGEEERSKSVGASLRNPLSRMRSRRASRGSLKEKEKARKADEDAPPVPTLVGNGAGAETRSSNVNGSDAAPAIVGTAATAAVAGGVAETKAQTGTRKEAEEEMMAAALPKGDKVEGSENTFLAPSTNRPHNGTVAYPFKLRNDMERSASTMTLESVNTGVVAPMDAVDSTRDLSRGNDGEAAQAVKEEDHERRDVVGGDLTWPKTGDVPGEKQRPKLETFVTAQEF
ncbi:hypothetical protein B9Z65_9258 [Elsinoe australis]|uniref:Alpha/beta hydrolase fold-3 domain-containing protein n=1 Tax=Elsinoe australis TaxID=40998 RepID=A0A2P7Z0X2_9PEZI|nr:hypothetical protein B9Z65_9258 [Elsinoe australis]